MFETNHTTACPGIDFLVHNITSFMIVTFIKEKRSPPMAWLNYSEHEENMVQYWMCDPDPACTICSDIIMSCLSLHRMHPTWTLYSRKCYINIANSAAKRVDKIRQPSRRVYRVCIRAQCVKAYWILPFCYYTIFCNALYDIFMLADGNERNIVAALTATTIYPSYSRNTKIHFTYLGRCIRVLKGMLFIIYTQAGVTFTD